MKRSKFSEEKTAYALRQTESDTPVGDVFRQLGVREAARVRGALSLSTWYPAHPCPFRPGSPLIP